MDVSEYEIKRKSQNRAAQRRYRMRLKQEEERSHKSQHVVSTAGSSSSGTSPFLSSVVSSSSDVSSNMLQEGECWKYLESRQAVDARVGDMAVGLGPAQFEWLPTSPFSPRSPSASVRTTSIDMQGMTSVTQPAVPKSSFDKIAAKGLKLISELKSLYNFGTELDLLLDDGDLGARLDSLEEAFRKCSNAAKLKTIDLC